MDGDVTNGLLTVADRSGSITISSLEGTGLFKMNGQKVSLGRNNLSTAFAGLIKDVGAGSLGSITKIGTGTFTLTNANSYGGGATVTAGTLLVRNTTGSATGSGTVQVTAGTLGGGGTAAGAVTIGAGAFLAPAAVVGKQTTFTTQGSLTLNVDGIYTYTAKAKGRKVLSDKVVANGVTIIRATFLFQPRIQGSLQAGTVFSVITNTSAAPISETFVNLPDGAVLTAGGNSFQANYEGGDGNDLTLTV